MQICRRQNALDFLKDADKTIMAARFLSSADVQIKGRRH